MFVGYAVISKRTNAWCCKPRRNLLLWLQFCAKDYDVILCSLTARSAFAILLLTHQQEHKEKYRGFWFSDLILALWQTLHFGKFAWQCFGRSGRWILISKEAQQLSVAKSTICSVIGELYNEDTCICSLFQKEQDCQNAWEILYYFCGNSYRLKYNIENLNAESVFFICANSSAVSCHWGGVEHC